MRRRPQLQNLRPDQCRSRPIPQDFAFRPTTDVDRVARSLAVDVSVSDYQLWRALKTVEDDLYRLGRSLLPVPIDLLYTRRILLAAQSRRDLVFGDA